MPKTRGFSDAEAARAIKEGVKQRQGDDEAIWSKLSDADIKALGGLRSFL